MKRSDKVRQAYPSDLTDAQWAVIEPLYSGMRTYKWSKRELTNAVLYFVKTGCQWRHLPLIEQLPSENIPPFVPSTKGGY
ncbi:MAG: transposase [Oscillospiraceae bacterium]|nr:transposase [Oscillospiraceae bacterium]